MNERRLHYRRQFLLCRDTIPSILEWNFLTLPNELYLYSHPDLDITIKQHDGLKIILLGYIFDPVDYIKNNEDILTDIIEKSDVFDSFLDTIKGYAGRFVFIYINSQSFNIIHDALGLREIYYCTSKNRIICGSQPNLIKEYSNPPLNISKKRDIRMFHDHDLKKMRSGRFWIGDETYFSGIKHLLPNHYLNIKELRAKRYWPREKLVRIDLDEAVRRSCSFLQAMLKAASHRNELMMAVTAGTDSRTLLAASKDLKDKIYYFINKHDNLNESHPDIYIPSAIFKKINIPFHIHILEGEMGENFKKIFLNNTFMSTDFVLSAIYNVYYKQHSHRLNILGVGEIGRTFFGDDPHNLNGYYLARSLKFKNSPYAIEQCQKWLKDSLPVARQCGVSVMTLLLWEQLLGNWGVVGNSESDIAIEEFDPFDSHYLYETLLGVDKKYAAYGESIIFNEMIKNMWPEVLEFPINPPYKKMDYVHLVLKKVGLQKTLKSLVYKMDWLKFRFKYRTHKNAKDEEECPRNSKQDF